MEREVALDELATAHAVALRLRDRGATNTTIADALGMPVESVPHLLTIADAKLADYLSQRERERERGRPGGRDRRPGSTGGGADPV